MLYVSETYINQTKGYCFGDSGGVIESGCETLGELYRQCQQEYGRCVSKVYQDKKDGRTVSVGWVFEKRMLYEDWWKGRGGYKAKPNADDYYIREVWVTVHSAPPDTIYHVLEQEVA